MDTTHYESSIFKYGSISACYFNASLDAPCEQGNVPVIGVDARSVGDVQAAVKFASSYNLRMAIENTGHDYAGRSVAHNAYMLWIHYLNNATYNPTFVPAGALKHMTLSHYVQEHANSAATAIGRSMIGGISAGGDVGAAGGWLQGVNDVAGFNPVNASGEFVTTNYQDSELFWALHGGGGTRSVLFQKWSLIPAWRNSLVEAVWGASRDNGTTYSEIEEARAVLSETMAQVSVVMPSTGSYFNEGYLFEPTPQQIYFGCHYDKLKQIKQSLVLMGSEDWAYESDLDRRL
ncbi:hypothetical protein BJ138DRAFT_1118071 [Hygrophoropsis aurantiaca]|uniref:Uncharacterized protein n=1 Tax=Hygrophoropsis aurantiaca TaxID=72124 RepID=A0ACB7ZXQ2_9AGAM|nr:hypothetical protein BJ138DRAFT_1118071 [Hygrophoropsis aurantiaca]